MKSLSNLCYFTILLIFLLETRSFQIDRIPTFIKSAQNKEQHKMIEDKAQELSVTHIDSITNSSLINKKLLKTTIQSIYEYELCCFPSQTYYTDSEDASYLIFDVAPYIIPNFNDTYAVINLNQTYTTSPGKIDLKVSFKWKKTLLATLDTLFGTGELYATGVSIQYTMSIQTTKSESGKPSGIKLTLLNPQSIKIAFSKSQVSIFPSKNTEDVKNVAKFVVNGTWEAQSVVSWHKNKLIQKVVPVIIKNIGTDMGPFDNNFTFVNKGSSSSDQYSVNFTKTPVFLKFGTQGQNYIIYAYHAAIPDYDSPVCPNASIYKPIESLKGNERSESFVSYCFYQYVYKWAIQVRQIDLISSIYTNWETNLFHFQLSQIIQIIPNVAKINFQQDGYGAGFVICSFNRKSLKIQQSQTDLFMLNLHINCNLTLGRDISNPVLQKFNVTTKMNIKGRILKNYVDLFIKQLFQTKITYQSVGQFVIDNQQVVNSYVNASLQNLFKTRTFGSGWVLSKNMERPRITSMKDGLLIYDSL